MCKKSKEKVKLTLTKMMIFGGCEKLTLFYILMIKANFCSLCLLTCDYWSNGSHATQFRINLWHTYAIPPCGKSLRHPAMIYIKSPHNGLYFKHIYRQVMKVI